MSIPNPIEALRALCLAEAAITALVGDHVYGGELPPDVTPLMPIQALVIKSASGGMPNEGWARIGKSNIEVWSYGGSVAEAGALKLVVYEKLKFLSREVVGAALLHWALPLTSGMSFRDPDTNWPVEVQTFQILAAETAVTA